MTADCRRCGASFVKRTVAVYCATCRPLANNERVASWVAAHRDRRKVHQRRWRAANPEKQSAAAERWRLANMERTRVHRRAAKKRNPLANRSYVRARKARLRGLTVVLFTPHQLRQRLAMFGDRCWMCGAIADSIDHVKPLAHGGAHMLANLRPACVPCNSRKGQRWPLEAVA